MMDTSYLIRNAEALIRSTDDTLLMIKHSSILNGKKVGVIGFNARPIAASLRRQGAITYVSDYWGDIDLASVSNACIAILAPLPGIRQRQPLDMPLHQSLIDNFTFLTKSVDLDYVFIGSGFDDNSNSLNSLFERGLIVGSSLDIMKKARDFSELSRISKGLDFKIPHRDIIQTIDNLREKSAAMKFPCLVRPSKSGGGSGIRFIRNQEDLDQLAHSILDQEDETSFILQQYVPGKDVSCSILSTGNQARALSVQGQLIGSPSAGRNCDFVYCGNYFPSELDTEIESKIRNICKRISERIGLKGSIGLDFVIDESNTIWLMEVNPRIQGTLEMLEVASDISITELHLKAWLGQLITDSVSFDPAVKMIVYSRKNGVVPDLSLFPNTFDRTPAGVVVNRGDPICTLINADGSLFESYKKTHEIADNIQQEIRSKIV